MSSTDLARPPEVVRGELVDWVPPEHCPICGEHWAAGPERDGWNQEHHCWKCGYVAGQDVVSIGAAAVNYQQMANMVQAAVDQAMNSPQMKLAQEFLDRYGMEGLQKVMDAEAARLSGTDKPPSGVPPEPPYGMEGLQKVMDAEAARLSGTDKPPSGVPPEPPPGTGSPPPPFQTPGA